MYVFAGAPWRTQAVVRDLQTAFTPARDGIPGNDDLGALSAGHVFTALGLGPVTAGAPFMAIGSPEFPEAVVTPEGDNTLPFTISAPDSTKDNKYVQAAYQGFEALDRAWLYDSTLRRGGRLLVEIGSEPNKDWAATAEATPPSVSDSSIERFGCRR